MTHKLDILHSYMLILPGNVHTAGLLSISLFYNHYYYHYFTKISITLPLPLQFKNHTINYITIFIKTTLITITITLASVLYITLQLAHSGIAEVGPEGA